MAECKGDECKDVIGVLNYNQDTRNIHLKRNGGLYALYDGIVYPKIGQYYEIYFKDEEVTKSILNGKSISGYTHDGQTEYSKEIINHYLNGITNISNFDLQDVEFGEEYPRWNGKRPDYIALDVEEGQKRLVSTPGDGAKIYFNGFLDDPNEALQETAKETYDAVEQTITYSKPYVNFTWSDEGVEISNGVFDALNLTTPQSYKNNNGQTMHSMYADPDVQGTTIVVPTYSQNIDEFDVYQGITYGSNNLLAKTAEMFKNHKIQTMVGRFHTSSDKNNGDYNNTYDPFDSAKLKGLGNPHGRGLVNKDVSNGDISYTAKESDTTNGYSNPYCRSWTFHHQYSKFKHAIRPFLGKVKNEKDENGERDIYDVNIKYRTRFVQNTDTQVTYDENGKVSDVSETITKRLPNGASYLKKNTVLQPETGLVRITPSTEDYEYNGKTHTFTEKKTNLKKYMFSIENLAWADERIYRNTYNLSQEQRGPNNGRIMWFPPYNLNFTESVSVKWNKNEFIGRGEPVMTYSNTERKGNLTFTILIDHPAIANSFDKFAKNSKQNSREDELDVLRFYAGCGLIDPDADVLDNLESKSGNDFLTKKQDDPESKIVPDEKGGKIVFYVYFPNDYSGVFGVPRKMTGTFSTNGINPTDKTIIGLFIRDINKTKLVDEYEADAIKVRWNENISGVSERTGLPASALTVGYERTKCNKYTDITKVDVSSSRTQNYYNYCSYNDVLGGDAFDKDWMLYFLCGSGNGFKIDEKGNTIFTTDTGKDLYEHNFGYEMSKDNGLNGSTGSNILCEYDNKILSGGTGILWSGYANQRFQPIKATKTYSSEEQEKDSIFNKYLKYGGCDYYGTRTTDWWWSSTKDHPGWTKGLNRTYFRHDFDLRQTRVGHLDNCKDVSSFQLNLRLSSVKNTDDTIYGDNTGQTGDDVQYTFAEVALAAMLARRYDNQKLKFKVADIETTQSIINRLAENEFSDSADAEVFKKNIETLKNIFSIKEGTVKDEKTNVKTTTSDLKFSIKCYGGASGQDPNNSPGLAFRRKCCVANTFSQLLNANASITLENGDEVNVPSANDKEHNKKEVKRAKSVRVEITYSYNQNIETPPNTDGTKTNDTPAKGETNDINVISHYTYLKYFLFKETKTRPITYEVVGYNNITNVITEEVVDGSKTFTYKFLPYCVNDSLYTLRLLSINVVDSKDSKKNQNIDVAGKTYYLKSGILLNDDISYQKDENDYLNKYFTSSEDGIISADIVYQFDFPKVIYSGDTPYYGETPTTHFLAVESYNDYTIEYNNAKLKLYSYSDISTFQKKYALTIVSDNSGTDYDEVQKSRFSNSSDANKSTQLLLTKDFERSVDSTEDVLKYCGIDTNAEKIVSNLDDVVYTTEHSYVILNYNSSDSVFENFLSELDADSYYIKNSLCYLNNEASVKYNNYVKQNVLDGTKYKVIDLASNYECIEDISDSWIIYTPSEKYIDKKIVDKYFNEDNIESDINFKTLSELCNTSIKIHYYKQETNFKYNLELYYLRKYFYYEYACSEAINEGDHYKYGYLIPASKTADTDSQYNSQLYGFILMPYNINEGKSSGKYIENPLLPILNSLQGDNKQGLGYQLYGEYSKAENAYTFVDCEYYASIEDETLGSKGKSYITNYKLFTDGNTIDIGLGGTDEFFKSLTNYGNFYFRFTNTATLRIAIKLLEFFGKDMASDITSICGLFNSNVDGKITFGNYYQLVYNDSGLEFENEEKTIHEFLLKNKNTSNGFAHFNYCGKDTSGKFNPKEDFLGNKNSCLGYAFFVSKDFISKMGENAYVLDKKKKKMTFSVSDEPVNLFITDKGRDDMSEDLYNKYLKIKDGGNVTNSGYIEYYCRSGKTVENISDKVAIVSYEYISLDTLNGLNYDFLISPNYLKLIESVEGQKVSKLSEIISNTCSSDKTNGSISSNSISDDTIGENLLDDGSDKSNLNTLNNKYAIAEGTKATKAQETNLKRFNKLISKYSKAVKYSVKAKYWYENIYQKTEEYKTDNGEVFDGYLYLSDDSYKEFNDWLEKVKNGLTDYNPEEEIKDEKVVAENNNRQIKHTTILNDTSKLTNQRIATIDVDNYTSGYDSGGNPLRYDDEYRFFNRLKNDSPLIYRNIIDKVKYFNPAYHSLSPEGFNARLTFLQQCTRQGRTCSVGSSDTAGNLSFGRMPICVLRIGDFINTKIAIENMSINYQNGDSIQWDLNQEGAGVQPMYATVTLSIAILGGQSLDGPINRLQNAISFNYYANAPVYDNRADRIITDADGNINYEHMYVPGENFNKSNEITK